MEDSGLLQCVGKLKVTKPKPVGFLCGTLPVPTDTAFATFHSAIVPIPHTIGAPRYQMLPAETDLNTLPLLSNFPEKVLMAACRTSEDVQWDSGVLRQNLFKKCEALAVSGLTEYGNEIDVVAPTDILKQVFKIPYSKAQLSVAVQRIGDTLILNAGPNIEEEEKLFRRQNNQSKCYDHSIFFNFAMHSVRAEACDCPSSYPPSSQKQPTPPSLPVNFGAVEDMYVPSTSCTNKSQFLNQNSGGGRIPSQSNDVKYFWDNKMNKQKRRSSNSVKRTHVGEKPRHPTQDSEQRRRFGNNGFLRVLFWQFHNFRMLLGSDMLLFSNDKYAAVSLHLWDVTSPVSPLMWLEAWLDNVMASVPELAICYHQNGVVQGYELLKTDDVFLLKGVSEDGIPAFHPQVVQQNGLSVLRFLQENCKQDPGAYWLFKGSGEDVIQLFDLSALPKSNTDDHDKVPSPISSLLQKGRRDTMLSLGTLLYRIAHRLSLSKAQTNRTKCAQFFKKCLDFLHEQDHMVVRAYAHEQFARFILKCNEELELASDTVLIEAEVKMANLEEECSEFSLSMFGADGQSIGLSEDDTATKNRNAIAGVSLNASVELDIEDANSQTDSNAYMHMPPAARNFPQKTSSSQSNDVLDMCPTLTSPSLSKTIVDPISSKLAAVHHVSQAIKYLRWKRQLQNAQGDLADSGSKFHERSTAISLSFCVCGDANCIEICDIREWLPKAKMDQKMWNLVLLLGESYLALGEAYKEDGQLHRALKVVELACLIYGSMPQHLNDAQFISSMDRGESYQLKLKESNSTPFFLRDAQEDLNFSLFNEGNLSEHLSSAYLFWPKAWSLIGDVYVEYQRTKGKEVLDKKDNRTSGNELRVSNEVVKEVMRLKKKLGHYKKNCISCSLVNCSCQSDRASSGNSASSSGNVPPSYSRKNNMKSILKTFISHGGNINATSSTRLPNYFHDSENDTFDSSNEEKHEIPADPSNAYSTVMGILAKGDTLNSTSSKQAAFSAPSFNDASKVGNGGIFRFHGGPKQDDAEYNLSVAIFCYDSARKALNDFPLDSAELISVLKKKGWASNELGRYKLDKQDFPSAEAAFADAIQAFKEVSDHTNIILIYCNLGHGRRSVAEELVSKLDELIEYDIFQNAYKQAILSAKMEYYESLKHYGAAKLELDSVGGTCDTLLYNEVYTQFANTYLRLGMLLAKEGIYVKVHAGTSHKDYSVNVRTSEQQKKITSANEAFREALSMYESLGVVRKQEAAFTHFQLATFHRDNCLKLVDLKHKQISFAKGENPHMKAKWYASLADKHWNKAIDFYGPMTHPSMYLNILLEQAVLSIDLSNSFNSYAMLEAALLHLLEGRKMVGSNNINRESDGLDSQLKSKFWNQLQSLLKNMLLLSSSSSSSVWDNGKLREMYRMSLKSCGFSQLHGMHKLWLS